MSTLLTILGIHVTDFLGYCFPILPESQRGTNVDWRHTETSFESKILYVAMGIVILWILFKIGRESAFGAIVVVAIIAATVMLIGSGFDVLLGGRNTLEFWWR